MAMEFIKAVQFQSLTLGAIQVNGIQPATIVFGDATGFSVAIGTDMSDPLAALNGTVWLRVDDTNPNVAIPTAGVATSENTAPVITATVEQFDPPTAV